MGASPWPGAPPMLAPSRRRRGWTVALLASGALMLSGCPNMDEQAHYRAFEPSEHFEDGASARPIPPHTVARDSLPGPPAFMTGRDNGELVNEIPVSITRELLQRGRERYTIYCAVCHGEDGDGRGIVVRRGFPQPVSYHDQRLRNEPAGHFFEVMTAGYGVMYSYADRVSPADRWAITAYIRALQRSRRALLNDVPPQERGTLTSQ